MKRRYFLTRLSAVPVTSARAVPVNRLSTGPIARLGAALVTALALGACGSAGTPGSLPAGDRLLRLDLGKRATAELVGYYAGGFLDPPADPFRAGLVVQADGEFYLNLDTLRSTNRWVEERLTSAAADTSSIDWDEFASVLEAGHAAVRRQPPTLQRLYDDVGYPGKPEEWVRVEVTGVMSTMRRRIAVQRAHLVEALRQFNSNGNQIIYPVGTAFVAGHYESDSLREVTAMRKRPDGHWDFYAYAADGKPALQTAARPRPLRVPTQCVGCHFGSKLYEPEKSFPAGAPSGPHGPRTLHVREHGADPEVVRFFDEHRKRSDHVLGLYATIFISRLRHSRSEGTIETDMAQLLEDLGL